VLYVTVKRPLLLENVWPRKKTNDTYAFRTANDEYEEDEHPLTEEEKAYFAEMEQLEAENQKKLDAMSPEDKANAEYGPSHLPADVDPDPDNEY